MIKIGEKMETAFILETWNGTIEDRVSFADLLDKPVIVSVYIKNNTSGCNLQNKSLAEHAHAIEQKGYRLIGLSKDSCKSHKNYAAKLGIDYILASDPEHAFINAVDAMVEKKMYGNVFKGPSRSAFIINKKGVVKAIIAKINTKRHGEELLELITDPNFELN